MKKKYLMLSVLAMMVLLSACSGNVVDNAVTGLLFFYAACWIGTALLFGFATKKIIENKGYSENWFWWGFFFGMIALIVALTKPDVRQNSRPAPPSTYYNSYSGYASARSQTNTAPQRDDEMERINKLKAYKELLDAGAITEEEFAEKKKSLMTPETRDRQNGTPLQAGQRQNETSSQTGQSFAYNKPNSYQGYLVTALRFSTQEGMKNYLWKTAIPNLAPEEAAGLQSILQTSGGDLRGHLQQELDRVLKNK